MFFEVSFVLERSSNLVLSVGTMLEDDCLMASSYKQSQFMYSTVIPSYFHCLLGSSIKNMIGFYWSLIEFKLFIQIWRSISRSIFFLKEDALLHCFTQTLSFKFMLSLCSKLISFFKSCMHLHSGKSDHSDNHYSHPSFRGKAIWCRIWESWYLPNLYFFHIP